MAMGPVFSEYFGFPCLFPFNLLIHINLTSGAGTIYPLVSDVPREISLTSPRIENNYTSIYINKKFWENLIAYFHLI
jgi:hypothetical protein